MAAHAQEPRPVVRHVEGLVLQGAAGGFGVLARAVYEVAGLNPASWLHPVDGVAVELGMRQQLDEVLGKLGRLIIEEFELDGLLRLISNGNGQGAVGPSSLLLCSLDGLVADPPVEHEVRVVLILVCQACPVQESLLRGKVHDFLGRLDEDQRRTGLGLAEPAAVVRHQMLQVLLVLRLKEAFHCRLHRLLLGGQVVYRSLQLLEGWILDFAIPRPSGSSPLSLSSLLLQFCCSQEGCETQIMARGCSLFQ